MKKLLKTITAIAASAVMLTSNAFAIGVNINGSPVSFDVEPIMVEDRVLVPIRAIFESLGAEVQWNEAAQSVTAKRGSDTITLTIGSPVMKVNGADVQLDSLPAFINDRTVVPVRAISEALGSDVSWDDAAQTVNITDNSGYVNPDAFNKYLPVVPAIYCVGSYVNANSLSGYFVDIQAQSGNTITFEISGVSGGGKRIYMIDPITAELNNNVAVFNWPDDGWGSSGNGSIEVHDGYVVLTMNQTHTGRSNFFGGTVTLNKE